MLMYKSDCLLLKMMDHMFECQNIWVKAFTLSGNSSQKEFNLWGIMLQATWNLQKKLNSVKTQSKI